MADTLPIPEDFVELLNGPHTAVFTTLLANGSPQSSPVWFWFDGERVSVSSVAGRLRQRHVERDPRVSFTLFDPADPMRYIEIRGTARVEDDPTASLRDRVVRKHGYADGARFDRPGTRRIMIHVDARRIVTR